MAGKPFWLWVFVTSTVCTTSLTAPKSFSRKALETLKTLMEAVYQAREGPPGQNLPEKYAA